MKIVVLDGYTVNPGDLNWEELKQLGEVTVYDRTDKNDTDMIAERIGDADIAVINKTPITEQVMERCPQVKMIAVLATGYNVVDCNAAKKRNIPVCNVPAYGTMAVAQYTIALLLAICHHVEHHSRTVHEGRWSSNPDFCYWDIPMVALDGKTMGIIGFGNIGQQTGRIAKAMGMNVIAYSRSRSDSGKDIAKYVPLEELLEKSDVIAIHCPLTKETEGLINKSTIQKMKDGVILLNTARGPVLVEEDVKAALESGKISAAAVDVVSTEPIKEDNPLYTAPNCIITPHIAWASKECREKIVHITSQNIQGYLNGTLQNVVNL